MIALDGAEERVELRERVYDYRPATGMAGAVEWHVNFADPRLLTAYEEHLDSFLSVQSADCQR